MIPIFTVAVAVTIIGCRTHSMMTLNDGKTDFIFCFRCSVNEFLLEIYVYYIKTRMGHFRTIFLVSIEIDLESTTGNFVWYYRNV